MISKFGIRSSSQTCHTRTPFVIIDDSEKFSQNDARRPATPATNKVRHALATTFVEPELEPELELEPLLLAEAAVVAVLAGFAVATP